MRVNSQKNYLILVNEAPLRESASWEFKKVYRSYLELKAQLEHHEANVRPAYYRWVSKMFADRFAEIEQLHAKVVRRSALLQRMVQLFVFESRSKASAFEQAQEELREILREQEEDAQSAHDGDAPNDEQDADQNQDDESEDTSDDDRRRAHGSHHHYDADDEPSGPRAEPSAESRIKSYYRKLAQALHPDLAGPQTELAREMWNETQDAYQAGDLSQLELLWTLFSLEKNPNAGDVAFSSLKNALKAMREKLKSAKRDKGRLARKDPSWGFGEKKKAKLEAKIQRDLDDEALNLNEALLEIESEMQSFTRSAESRRSNRGGRRRGHDRQSSFEF